MRWPKDFTGEYSLRVANECVANTHTPKNQDSYAYVVLFNLIKTLKDILIPTNILNSGLHLLGLLGADTDD